MEDCAIKRYRVGPPLIEAEPDLQRRLIKILSTSVATIRGDCHEKGEIDFWDVLELRPRCYHLGDCAKLESLWSHGYAKLAAQLK